MPIVVNVQLNDRTLTTLHIGRLGSDAGRVADRTHTYAVVQQAVEPTDQQFELSPHTFEHNYSDDVLICVEKALEALRQASENPAELKV